MWKVTKFWFFSGPYFIVSVLCKSPYSIWIHENTNWRKLLIRFFNFTKKKKKKKKKIENKHCFRDHSFSTYTKSPEKLTFFTPWKKILLFGKFCARTKWTISYRKILINPQFPIDCRSNHRSCSSKKTVLKNFTKTTRKHTCHTFFFQPQVWNLLKKRLRRGRLFVNILWSF